MSATEIRKFVADFSEVRLRFIADQLRGIDEGIQDASEPLVDLQDAVAGEPADLDTADVTVVTKSITEADAISQLTVEDARGDWQKVRPMVGLTLLSDKQRRILLPTLGGRRAPGALADADLARDLQMLNDLLKKAAASGLTVKRYNEYASHLRIHGASQNIGGAVGTIGATVAIEDALNQLDPTCIIDRAGGPLPAGRRSPGDIYHTVYEQRRGNAVTRSLLLTNGRAIVFASDPDVAIISSLGVGFGAAEEARDAWEAVRANSNLWSNRVHVYAVGEVKTATDPQNLHERLALGARETSRELGAHRFLMMAILTPELLASDASRSPRSSGRAPLSNRSVERFTNVFNLYFAWGYDTARSDHPVHWDDFVTRIGDWCLP
jgi:hypothetical protein